MKKLMILGYLPAFMCFSCLNAQEDLSQTPSVPQPPVVTEVEQSSVALTSERADSLFSRFSDDEQSLVEPIKPVVEEKKSEKPAIEVEKIAVAEKKPVSAAQQFLEPWEYGDPLELVEIQFENAELSAFISYIEKKYGLQFIMDDQLQPLPQNGKSILGTKISFKTHKPLAKKQAWNIFVTFLDMAGLGVQPGPAAGIFRINSVDGTKQTASVYRGPLPLYIGVDPSLIPDNDTRIRYVYFVENTSLDVVKNVVDSMKSATAPNIVVFPELRALVLSDRGVNVKSIVTIIKELDKVSMPETLSVVKLKRTDATKVADLYKSLIRDDTQNALQARLLGGRKSSTVSYFSDGTRVIPDPQTNSLILLGTRDSVKKIEEFLAKEIDRELDVPFSPLHVYTLKYVDAEAVAAILKESVQFQQDSEAAKYGGVRDGNKYFKATTITAEKSGNRLIINADYEDYLKLFEILQKIDTEQPQVCLKMILMSVEVDKNKAFGAQVRDKVPSLSGLLGNQVNYQTSGLAGSPIVQNPNGNGATRLLGDLVNLVSNIVTPGSTVVTFGSDAYGVWGLLRVLETLTKVSVIANPYGVTTHKYPLKIAIGETRRVTTGVTLISNGNPQNSFADLSANLEVNITPQVSYEGLITLDVSIVVEQFTEAGVNSGNRTHKEIKTSVIVNDNDVIALGGLMRDTVTDVVTKVPILGDIPVLGWFFKNKTKVTISESLLILITPEIVPPYNEVFVDRFTQEKIEDSIDTMNQFRDGTVTRDPINRWFFAEQQHQDVDTLNDFYKLKNAYLDEEERKAHEEKSRIERERIQKRIEKKKQQGERRLSQYLDDEKIRRVS